MNVRAGASEEVDAEAVATTALEANVCVAVRNGLRVCFWAENRCYYINHFCQRIREDPLEEPVKDIGVCRRGPNH